MSLRKFHGETGGPEHNNEQLFWPGTVEGFPVIGRKGSTADLKKEELENLDLRRDFKSKMFELWDPQQKAEFDHISDKLVNGLYVLVRRADNWDTEQKHYRVWMEWCQIYGELPESRKP